MEDRRVETERLILRPWRESDARMLYRYASDPEIGPMAGWPTHESIEDSRRVIRDVLAVPENYAITIKSRPLSDEPVGSIGLMIGSASNLDLGTDEGEIGYWIGRPFWGNGYIPEAVIALIRHAFVDLELSAVWCGWDEGNEKSRRVQEKVGFRPHHTIANRRRPLMGDVKTEYVTCITCDEWKRDQSGDPTDTATIEAQQREKDDVIAHVPLISFIRSGGQTGVDRGALDAARDEGIPICGWCPKDGMAEDMTDPPGVLKDYPELTESPSTGYVQRTAWNVRDANATLVIAPGGIEPKSGTEVTVEFAHAFGRPVKIMDSPDQVAEVMEWLVDIGRGLTLNVAGPRASKLPEVYAMTRDVVSQILTSGL